MNSQVTDWIIEWFVKNTDIEKNEIQTNLHENYLIKGWIDSFKFISFITDIEDNFKLHFSNDEFQDRSFSTIYGITKIIEEKTDAKI